MQVLICYFCLCVVCFVSVLMLYFCAFVVCVFTCYLAEQLSPILGVASFTSAPPLRTFLHGSTFHIEAPVPKCLTVQNVNNSSLANRRSTDWQTGLGAVHLNWIKIPPWLLLLHITHFAFLFFCTGSQAVLFDRDTFCYLFFQIFFSCLKQTMFKRTYGS